MKLFEQVSCRFDILEQALDGREIKNKQWTSLEDLVLNKPFINEEAFLLLKEEKGEDEIESRRKFLSLN